MQRCEDYMDIPLSPPPAYDPAWKTHYFHNSSILDDVTNGEGQLAPSSARPPPIGASPSHSDGNSAKDYTHQSVSRQSSKVPPPSPQYQISLDEDSEFMREHNEFVHITGLSQKGQRRNRGTSNNAHSPYYRSNQEHTPLTSEPRPDTEGQNAVSSSKDTEQVQIKQEVIRRRWSVKCVLCYVAIYACVLGLTVVIWSQVQLQGFHRSLLIISACLVYFILLCQSCGLCTCKSITCDQLMQRFRT